MGVETKGLGELIDEGITLSFKLIVTKDENYLDRISEILEYLIEKHSENNEALNKITVLALAMSNAICWNAQELVSSKNVLESSIWANVAQHSNKMRNILIGELNGGEGIITKKTY